MTHKRLDPKHKERCAFLVGPGLRGDGAAGAVKISTAAGELGALCVMLPIAASGHQTGGAKRQPRRGRDRPPPRSTAMSVCRAGLEGRAVTSS
jgi:hypothetical protein